MHAAASAQWQPVVSISDRVLKIIIFKSQSRSICWQCSAVFLGITCMLAVVSQYLSWSPFVRCNWLPSVLSFKMLQRIVAFWLVQHQCAYVGAHRPRLASVCALQANVVKCPRSNKEHRSLPATSMRSERLLKSFHTSNQLLSSQLLRVNHCYQNIPAL